MIFAFNKVSVVYTKHVINKGFNNAILYSDAI